MDIVEQARQRVAQMQHSVAPPTHPPRASEAPPSLEAAKAPPSLEAAKAPTAACVLAIVTPGDWTDLLKLEEHVDEVWSVGVASKLLNVSMAFPLQAYPYDEVSEGLKTAYVVGDLAHAMALAVHSGYAEIHVFGNPPSADELPCVEFLLSIAIQRGARVYGKHLLWNKHPREKLMNGYPLVKGDIFS